MGIGEKQIREERKWLEDVISEIQKQLEKYEEFLSSFKKELIRTQQDMRDEISLVATDLNDLADIWQYQMDIARYGARYKHSSKQVGRLLRMLGNPYFARLDFAEEGYEKTETMYIGISNLSVEETGEYLVYDWRAPVSGMFYDYETGPARYKCPAGIINGELLLKRQYKISKGQLIYAFDSSIKIDDEILQGILARSSSSKMKTIVTTIQKEQNYRSYIFIIKSFPFIQIIFGKKIFICFKTVKYGHFINQSINRFEFTVHYFHAFISQLFLEHEFPGLFNPQPDLFTSLPFRLFKKL